VLGSGLKRTAAPSVAIGLLVAACGWKELDAIGTAPLADKVPGLDAAADTQETDAQETDAQETDTQGADAQEAGTEEEADGPDEAAEAGPSTAACSGDQTPLLQWTFDTTVQGWALSLDTGVDASVAWMGTMGDPTPGALQVDVTPYPDDSGTINGAWLFYGGTLGNLAGRTVSAWVYLDSGTSPSLKVFVQTGGQYEWADNGIVLLASRSWTCVSLPISTPAYNQPNYDPTNVIRVGLQLLGAAPFQLYVDTVNIY
jgi:hypothetical protein